MAILENRLINNKKLKSLKLLKRGCNYLFIIIFSSSAFFFAQFSTVKTALLETTGTFVFIANDLKNIVNSCFSTFYNIFSEKQKLELENKELKHNIAVLKEQIRMLSRVKEEHAAMRDLLNLKENIVDNFISTRIMPLHNNPLTKSAIIALGKNDGVKINNVVYNKDGLIGKISTVGNKHSIVTLLNDPSFKVPVILNNSRVKGILHNEKGSLRVKYITDDRSIIVGESVYTSGDGLIFRNGIFIGIVNGKDKNDILVSSEMNLNNIDYVLVDIGSKSDTEIDIAMTK